MLDRDLSPVNITLSISNPSTAAWQVDVTADDPFLISGPSSLGGRPAYPNLTTGLSTQFANVYQSSQLSGGGLVSGTGPTSAVSSLGIGVITQPITALRLTVTSASSASNLALTVLQAGFKQ
jgi:hypothetical protein